MDAGNIREAQYSRLQLVLGSDPGKRRPAPGEIDMFSALVALLPIATAAAILVFGFRRRTRRLYLQKLRDRICEVDSV